jgi:nickel-dependent lactate racemase
MPAERVVSADGLGFVERRLHNDEIAAAAGEACAAIEPGGKRILVVVPDATRSCPLGPLFRLLHAELAGAAARLDFLVALGTHPPLSEAQLLALFDLTPEERAGPYADVGLHNHAWKDRSQLIEIGRIEAEEIGRLSDGLFEQEVRVTCNRMIEETDHVLLVGPVFPHEVAGFSGGNKYVAPGIAGAEIIDFFHWLGALITNPQIIGRKWTPVREVIDRAAAFLPVPRSAICLVVEGSRLAGLYHGQPGEAWSAAADLSARLHIVHHARPYHTVLSCAPAMYDELWVGGKCMYKLEPVVADGGRLIIFAPHIRHISAVHGEIIERVGYHVRDYFLAQWERFEHLPWGVLAHSTHVKGVGSYRDGVEQPRIEVVLATGIPEETCRRIDLGYMDPASVRVADYEGREHEGVLCVPRAGEVLHRLEAERGARPGPKP